MKKIIALISIGAMLLASGVSFADSQTDQLAMEKLGRGAANLATSPYEVIYRINEVTDEKGSGYGLTWGLGYGIVRTLTRAVVGAYELITFPIPMPQDYKPIITDPEYFFYETSSSSSSK
ncbi:exosortase system-associated protein, TIGR04073 family [Candidatus Omnitrophota bacterium]